MVLATFVVILIGAEVIFLLYIANMLNKKAFAKSLNPFLAIGFFFSFPFIIWTFLISWKMAKVQVDLVFDFLQSI